MGVLVVVEGGDGSVDGGGEATDVERRWLCKQLGSASTEYGRV